MNLEIIITQGLTFGSIYGLAALGFGILYHTTKVFHVAYGAIGVLGSFVAVSLNTSGSVVPLVLSLLAGVGVAFAVTLAAFAGLYRFMERRGADRLTVFVASLGLGFAIEPLIVLAFGPEIRSYAIAGLLEPRNVLGLQLSDLAIATILLAFGTLGVLSLALARTRWGYQVRALASNRELSSLVGARTGVTLLGVYAVGGFCCAAAATLLGMFTNVTPTGGTTLALYAAIAVIAAGVESYVSGFLLAMALGLLQPTMSFAVSSEWATVGVFGVALVAILVAPTGLHLRPRSASP
jgi:branched-chain amino acid transport system permease protein